jgi:AcrR family transcriptional regulator
MTAEVRRRDAARTKAAIFEAATYEFSHHGYSEAGVRKIAARAGVNSALVLRYFGSKEHLFEEVLRAALPVDILLTEERSAFGRRVAEVLTGPASDSAGVVTMSVFAAADPGARAVAVRLLEEIVIRTLADWLGAPDGEARAARITALCTGFVTYRRILPLKHLTGAFEAKAAAWLAQSLQAIVDA